MKWPFRRIPGGVHFVPFNVVIARPPGPILDPMPWGSMCRIYGNVLAVSYDGVSEEVVDVTRTTNLVTNDGDLLYAEFGNYLRAPSTTNVADNLFTDNATPSLFDGVLEVWNNLDAASSPSKGATRATLLAATDNGAGTGNSLIWDGASNRQKTIESGYPKPDDDSAANTGAAANVITFKYSYGVDYLNHSGMDDCSITNPNPGASEKIMCWAEGLNKTKTNSDTLDIFWNQTQLGTAS